MEQDIECNAQPAAASAELCILHHRRWSALTAPAGVESHPLSRLLAVAECRCETGALSSVRAVLSERQRPGHRT